MYLVHGAFWDAKRVYGTSGRVFWFIILGHYDEFTYTHVFAFMTEYGHIDIARSKSFQTRVHINALWQNY